MGCFIVSLNVTLRCDILPIGLPYVHNVHFTFFNEFDRSLPCQPDIILILPVIALMDVSCDYTHAQLVNQCHRVHVAVS